MREKIIVSLALFSFLFALWQWRGWKEMEREREEARRDFLAPKPQLQEAKKLEAGEVYFVRFKHPIRVGEKFFYVTKGDGEQVYVRRSENASWTNITNGFHRGISYSGDDGIWVKVTKSGVYEFYLNPAE